MRCGERNADGLIRDIYAEAPAREDRDVMYRGFSWRVWQGVFAPYPALESIHGITPKNIAMYRGKRVLDLGSGCGVRAVLAGLSGARSVVATDVCLVACANTQLNASSYGVAVAVVCTDMFAGIRGKFDTIVAYLPSRDAPIVEPHHRAIHDLGLRLTWQLIEEAPHYLTDEGRLYTSILDQGNVALFRSSIHERGYGVETERIVSHETGEWHLLSLVWPSSGSSKRRSQCTG